MQGPCPPLYNLSKTRNTMKENNGKCNFGLQSSVEAGIHAFGNWSSESANVLSLLNHGSGLKLHSRTPALTTLWLSECCWTLPPISPNYWPCWLGLMEGVPTSGRPHRLAFLDMFNLGVNSTLLSRTNTRVDIGWYSVLVLLIVYLLKWMDRTNLSSFISVSLLLVGLCLIQSRGLPCQSLMPTLFVQRNVTDNFAV